ncbi:MAG: DUF3592 domain-containing protein [Rubrivivax sp.]|nr:DUF3592 domain-containing protein [Rubrivivax sp.]
MVSAVFAGQHRLAVRLHHVLAAGLLLAALGMTVALALEVVEQIEVLTAWPRHEGRVEALSDSNPWIELEVEQAVLQRWPQLPQPLQATPRDGQARVLLRRPAQVLADWGSSVSFAVDPQQPDRARLLDPLAMGVPIAFKLLLLVLLALAWLGQRRLPWGRDQIWLDGAWRDSAGAGQHPGQRAGPQDRVHEPPELRRSLRWWTWVMGAVTLLMVSGWAIEVWAMGPDQRAQAQVSPLMALTLLLVLGLDLVLAHHVVAARTRRVVFDDEGLADVDLFRTRRVTWAAVARFDKLNLNQADQERHDRGPLNRRQGRRRPRSDWCWVASDPKGQALLRIAAGVEAQPAFQLLQQRLHGQLQAAPPVFAPQRATSNAVSNAVSNAADVRAHTQAPPWIPARAGVWLLLLVLSPFLLGTVLSTSRSLWFVTLADRAQGKVVEKSEGSPTSLVVAYTPLGGQMQQIHSNGSEAYSDLALGATITVFYDPAQPARARLDRFEALWLWPLILGGVTLLVALLVALPLAWGLRLLRRRF